MKLSESFGIDSPIILYTRTKESHQNKKPMRQYITIIYIVLHYISLRVRLRMKFLN